MLKQGLFNKYNVTKTDGSTVDPDAQYFVLRIDTDPAAWAAVGTYARCIESDNPEFAEQLRKWLFSVTPRTQQSKE